MEIQQKTLISYAINFNPLSANFTKWWNTLKQFAGNLPTNCLSVFGHFVVLALKWLRKSELSSCFTVSSGHWTIIKNLCKQLY